jgi:opacity protein-like surface antigen
MRNRLFVLATAFVALVSPMAAQAAHPDFSGTWVLDATKTEIDGQIPAPAAATYTVVQHGDSIAVDQKSSSEQGEMALRKVWRVDGQAWVNTMTYQGTDMTLRSVLRWDGAVLLIHTTSDFAGTPVEQSESWTLAADGKTLTQRTTTSANGEYYASMTLVFSKK